MNAFLDTEFYNHGDIIEPISIALVAENGAEFYAEFAEFKFQPGDNHETAVWLRNNVMPKLTGPLLPRSAIRFTMADWLKEKKITDIWAYFGAYDWVIFCNVLGWKNKPAFLHPVCHEIYGLLQSTNDIPNDNEHHALSDARWNHEVWNQRFNS